MPAKDIYHATVKTALSKDGWTITHDPLVLRWGTTDVHVDLGAERLLAAEKQGQKIAVEIKSFVSKSHVDELEKALGQYILYRNILEEKEPDRILYLAVHEEALQNIFEEAIGQLILSKTQMRLIVFDQKREVILKWMP